MFTEIIHVNGTYNPELQTHAPGPDSDELIPRLQGLANRAINSGWEVLYTPNLNGNVGGIIGSAEATSAALQNDPFLKGLDKQTRDSVITRLDGVGRPLDYVNETLLIEDDLAKRHLRGFVLGAFATDCVLSRARQFKTRVPEARIAIDPKYCLYRSGTVNEPLAIGGVDVDWIDMHFPRRTQESWLWLK